MPLSYSFEGKKILVTGGARGIGYEIVKRFYEDTQSIFVIDANGDLLSKLESEFPGVKTYCVDIRNWDEAVKTVFDLTPVDILINNAGVLNCSTLLEATGDLFDYHFGVNVKGLLAVAQGFVKGNIEHGHPGIIVNMSSVSDREAFPHGGIYSSTKAAVTKLTQVMAFEWSEHNIRTNCIAPCFVGTELVASIPPHVMEKAAGTMERIPIKTPLEIRHIVDSVLFLSSPYSEQINGTAMVIDGGLTAA